MKNLLTALSALLSLGLFSCQKEVEDIFAGSGNNASGVLQKVVTKSGADSTVFNFSYNGNNKLVEATTSGIDSGNVIDIREIFIRNGQNIITQIITREANLTANGIDSVITKVNYSGGRYINRVSAIDLFGFFTFRDSVVLTYNGSGNVITEEDFLDVGTGYQPNIRTEYTYSGKNISVVKVSAFDDISNSYAEQYSRSLSYDAKTSPLILGNEAFAIGAYNWFSGNNVVKSVAVSTTDPTQNEIQDVTYTYNAFNKPVTAITTIQGGLTANSNFYYR